MTPEEAKFLTGVVTEAMDAGQVLRYEDSVGTKFEPGKNIRITYVFYPDVETNEQRTLIGFYVNGGGVGRLEVAGQGELRHPEPAGV